MLTDLNMLAADAIPLVCHDILRGLQRDHRRDRSTWTQTGQVIRSCDGILAVGVLTFCGDLGGGAEMSASAFDEPPEEHQQREDAAFPQAPQSGSHCNPFQPANPEPTRTFHTFLTRLRAAGVCRFKNLRVTRCYGDNGADLSVGLIWCSDI